MVGLFAGGLYYYLSKQIPEIPEIPEKPAEEKVVPPFREELPKEEVTPTKPAINIEGVQSTITSLIDDLKETIRIVDSGNIPAILKSLENYEEKFNTFISESDQLNIEAQDKTLVNKLRLSEWENYKLFLDLKQKVISYPQLTEKITDLENLIESHLKNQIVEAAKALLIPKFRETSYLDQNFLLTLLKNFFGKISVQAASQIVFRKVALASDIIEEKCGIFYEGTKDHTKALDFIIIGADKIVLPAEGGEGYECRYSDKFNNFLEDARYAVNDFLSIRPYSDYKDIFNFYYSKKVTECISGKFYCENWQKIANNCGIDYDGVIILENGCFEKILPFGSEIRGRGIVLVSDDYALVEQDAHTFVHEISHLLGLADTYCYEMPGPNVFSSLEQCGKPRCKENFDYTAIPGGTCCYQLPYCQWKPYKSEYYATNEKSLMQRVPEAIKKDFSEIEKKYLKEFLFNIKSPAPEMVGEVIHKKVIIDPVYAKETPTMTLIQPCWTYESWIDLDGNRYRQELRVSSSQPPGFEYIVESTDEAGNPVEVKQYCDIEIDITDGETGKKLALNPYLKAAEWIDPKKGKHGIGEEIIEDPYTVFKTRLETEECHFDGTEIFEGKETYKIKCPLFDIGYRLYYIDAQTYLPVEELSFQRSWAEGEIELFIAYKYIIGEIIDRESLPVDFFELKIPIDYKLQEWTPFG